MGAEGQVGGGGEQWGRGEGSGLLLVLESGAYEDRFSDIWLSLDPSAPSGLNFAILGLSLLSVPVHVRCFM